MEKRVSAQAIDTWVEKAKQVWARNMKDRKRLIYSALILSLLSYGLIPYILNPAYSAP